MHYKALNRKECDNGRLSVKSEGKKSANKINPLGEEQNSVTPCLQQLHGEDTPATWTSASFYQGLKGASSGTLARERSASTSSQATIS